MLNLYQSSVQTVFVKKKILNNLPPYWALPAQPWCFSWEILSSFGSEAVNSFTRRMQNHSVMTGCLMNTIPDFGLNRLFMLIVVKFLKESEISEVFDCQGCMSWNMWTNSWVPVFCALDGEIHLTLNGKHLISWSNADSWLGHETRRGKLQSLSFHVFSRFSFSICKLELSMILDGTDNET